MITITVERVQYDGGMRVTLRFPKDRDLTERVKMLPGAIWSERLKCWHIPYTRDVVSMLLETFSRDAYVDYTAFRKTNPVISFSEDGKRQKVIRIVRSQSFRSPGYVQNKNQQNHVSGQSRTIPPMSVRIPAHRSIKPRIATLWSRLERLCLA